MVRSHASLSERLHEGVRVDRGHDALEVLVNPSESWLFLRQCASRENRLQVEPLALNGVHVRQTIRQRREHIFPHACLFLEWREERRVLQRRHEVLVVGDLGEEILPLFDE